jgi:hypothetical protein
MLKSSGILCLAIGIMAIISVSGGPVSAGMSEPVLLADMDGGGSDMNIDLAVRQVKVTPVRAHVGDVIRAELLVNGKVAGSQLFSWGMSPGERLYRLSFDWDTRKVSPGAYKIGAQAFVWEDSSPFDNRLDVTQSVLIVPAGAGFPGGEAEGGTATETDPRFDKSRVGG